MIALTVFLVRFVRLRHGVASDSMFQGEVGENGRLKAGNDCKWLRGLERIFLKSWGLGF
jgi:hypothetical protein